MSNVRIKKVTTVFALTLALAAGLVGCGSATSGNAGSASSVEGLTGGVAATVNGTEIAEDTITTYIQSFRSSTGQTEEQAWGEYLASVGLDPASIRKEVIEFYISLELERTGAEEMGITVTEEEVTEQIALMRANYSSDEAWEEALAQAGMTEDEYRDNLTSSILESHMQDKLAEDAGPVTDEDILEDVKMYAEYFNGAKRSSHILFAEDDKETAEKVLSQLKSGELDFAEAAKEYSQDTRSGAEGGDIGWDMMSMMQGSGLVEEYTNALAELDKDEMTEELVKSTYGYHIIKVTDVYTLPEGGITSVDQAPTELVDYLRSIHESNKGPEAFNEWLEKTREEADVVINEMPEGLPYDLDITKYQTAESSSSEVAGEDEIVIDEEEDTIEGELTEEEAAALLEEEGQTADAAADGASSADAAAEGASSADAAAEDASSANAAAEDASSADAAAEDASSSDASSSAA